MIAMIVALAVVALLLVWLSLSMAATEGAVGRVTRASLNNLILEIQTDAELSQFIRDRKSGAFIRFSGWWPIAMPPPDRARSSASAAMWLMVCS